MVKEILYHTFENGVIYYLLKEGSSKICTKISRDELIKKDKNLCLEYEKKNSINIDKKNENQDLNEENSEDISSEETQRIHNNYKNKKKEKNIDEEADKKKGILQKLLQKKRKIKISKENPISKNDKKILNINSNIAQKPVSKSISRESSNIFNEIKIPNDMDKFSSSDDKNEKSINKNKEVEIIKNNISSIYEREGTLLSDTPIKILNIGYKNRNEKKLYCLIKWKQENGIKILDSIVEYEKIKEGNPLMLLDYFETRIFFLDGD